jgi:hypothetical protein
MNNQLNREKLNQILLSVANWIVWLYSDDNLSLALWDLSTRAAKPLVFAFVCGEVAREKLHNLSLRMEPNTPTFTTDVQM